MLGEEDRATYVFDTARGSLAQLEACLRRIQFRRDPTRLAEELTTSRGPLEALLRLPAVETLRKAYRGRAVHSNAEAWIATLGDLLRA